MRSLARAHMNCARRSRIQFPVKDGMTIRTARLGTSAHGTSRRLQGTTFNWNGRTLADAACRVLTDEVPQGDVAGKAAFQAQIATGMWQRIEVRLCTRSGRVRSDALSARYKIPSNRPNERTRASNTVASAATGSGGRSVSAAGLAAARTGRSHACLQSIGRRFGARAAKAA